MKNKYQKPAIYLTPEHTEGIYLASGAAGAAGSVTATFMGVWDRWAGGGKGLVAVNWNNVAGNVALTLSFNTPIDVYKRQREKSSTSPAASSALFP